MNEGGDLTVDPEGEEPSQVEEEEPEEPGERSDRESVSGFRMPAPNMDEYVASIVAPLVLTPICDLVVLPSRVVEIRLMGGSFPMAVWGLWRL